MLSDGHRPAPGRAQPERPRVRHRPLDVRRRPNDVRDREYALSEGHQLNWEEFQAYADLDRNYPWPEVPEFLKWLRMVDIQAVVERSNPPLENRLIRAGARHTPHPMYYLAYPMYRRLKRRLG